MISQEELREINLTELSSIELKKTNGGDLLALVIGYLVGSGIAWLIERRRNKQQ